MANLVIGFDDMGGSHRDPLNEGAIDVATAMGQVQAENRPFGQRVMDRRPFARKIGQDQNAIGPHGGGCRLLRQGTKGRVLWQVWGEPVAKPMGQCARCRKTRH